MSGASLGTLLVQRLDAVLGHAVASHPHMVSGVRRDAVAGPGIPQRTPPTDESDRKPSPADEANTLTPLAIARNRLAQPATRLLLAATPDRAHTAPSTNLEEPADADAIDEHGPTLVGRSRDLHQAAASGAAGRPLLPLLSGSPSAPTLLGHTARLIHTLLADTTLDGQALRGANPLTTGPGTQNPVQLAAHLKNVIELSGLFYERHLMDVAFGRRDLHQVRAEPQARWAFSGPNDAQAQAPAQTSTQAPAQPTHTPTQGSTQGAAQPAHTPVQASAQAPAQPVHTPAQASTDVANGTSAQARPEPTTAPMPQDALMRLQLEALATQTIQWRGEAWDGVPMDWRIVRDDPPPVDDGAQPWRTALTLVLPRLGRVDIELAGMGSRLSMRMAADDASAELDNHKQTLLARLQAQGLAADIAVTAAQATQPAAGDEAPA